MDIEQLWGNGHGTRPNGREGTQENLALLQAICASVIVERTIFELVFESLAVGLLEFHSD